MEVKKVVIYKTKNGKEPFREWFLKLDNTLKIAVMSRLKRIECGNYGLYKVLPGGISELKFSSGLRVYFAELDKIIILLLFGGDKRKQSDDIKKSQEFFNDYINRSKGNE